ncbi:MAG: phosphatidylglycerophosphatase A [Magnetococcales bacterium]|nr:phosphatidylglycerophosphatase A [Magnetococcales bacterium]
MPMLRPPHLLATFFGSGLLPKAPGTWGTLATVPLAYLSQQAGPVWGWTILCVVCVVGVWSAGVVCRETGREDPSEVVIDEVAGFLLTMIDAPHGAMGMVIGFVLFRLFDIFKPWPVNALERLPGGWGVMADDLAAGAYAAMGMVGLVWMGWL